MDAHYFPLYDRIRIAARGIGHEADEPPPGVRRLQAVQGHDVIVLGEVLIRSLQALHAATIRGISRFEDANAPVTPLVVSF